MAHLLLGKILENAPGVKKDGATFIMNEELDATAFIALGQEVLQIQRLSRLEIASDILRMTNHKGEAFFFPPEQLVGFKFGAPEKVSRGSAGFQKT